MGDQLALVVITNGSIGPVSLPTNTPVCQLSVVRPEFERQVLEKENMAMPTQPRTQVAGSAKRRTPSNGSEKGENSANSAKDTLSQFSQEEGYQCEGMATHEGDQENVKIGKKRRMNIIVTVLIYSILLESREHHGMFTLTILCPFPAFPGISEFFPLHFFLSRLFFFFFFFLTSLQYG